MVLRAQKNGAPDEADAGERWGCLVQDRPSRFIAACATGCLGDELVERAVTLTVARTQGRPLNWCSDGWRGYAAILTRAYRQPVRSGQPGRPPLVVPPDVRLTQTIKHRDEHGKLLSIEIRAALGEVLPEPATVLLMRTEPRRYLPHTPAMALGLTVHPWSWISFLTTSLSTTSK